eukprot:gene5717-9537_t
MSAFAEETKCGYCPMILDPVCGDEITYSSECVAKCAKAVSITKGKCDCKKPIPPNQIPQ